MSSRVHVDVTTPPRFDRLQILVRLIICIALGWFGIGTFGLVLGLYLALPMIVACSISFQNAESFATGFGPDLWRVLSWLIRLSAYITLLIDRFPSEEDNSVRFQIQIARKPTVGSALLRLVTSLPSTVVLGALLVASSVLCLLGAILVLVGVPQPVWRLAYQRAVLRWQTRLIAYHASLVDDYPPFCFDTDRSRDELPAGALR